MQYRLPASTPAPTVTFLGATQSVTGSMHLVQAGDAKVLLDCGLSLGRTRSETRRRSGRFPFDPAGLDAVVLSHAHVDHCGNLPNLVRQGFSGPIYCTPPTRDLLAVLLTDSARLQEEDAAWLRFFGGEEDAQPLFGREHADRTLAQCVAVPYEVPYAAHPDVRLRFVDAGHVLGSAMVHLTLGGPGGECTVTYTGDLGRRGFHFLPDPRPVPAADLIISESTYGGRTHQPLDRLEELLAEAVARTAERGGKVFIPAFSLGRAQLVVHHLQKVMNEGRAPQLPIYVDSPLTADIAGVYQLHPDRVLPGAVPPPEGEAGPVRYVRGLEESRDLSTRREACVVVASGGMCEGGRILHHLRHNVDDPRNTIALVSYQAPGSLGRRLLEKGPTVRFAGRDWNKWADVVDLNGFSGHADRDDFRALLGPAAGRAGKVRLVHGEPEQADALAGTLRELGFADVDVPHAEDLVAVA